MRRIARITAKKPTAIKLLPPKHPHRPASPTSTPWKARSMAVTAHGQPRMPMTTPATPLTPARTKTAPSAALATKETATAISPAAKTIARPTRQTSPTPKPGATKVPAPQTARQYPRQEVRIAKATTITAMPKPITSWTGKAMTPTCPPTKAPSPGHRPSPARGLIPPAIHPPLIALTTISNPGRMAHIPNTRKNSLPTRTTPTTSRATMP